MTDAPPPRPSNEPGDERQPTEPRNEPVGATTDGETSRLQAGGLPTPGEQYPGPGHDGWTPVAPPTSSRGGRIRRMGSRMRGSRVALAIVGVVVAAGLVLGGLALADGGHDGKEGRDGRGAASQRDGENNNSDDSGADSRDNNAKRNDANRANADDNERGGRGRDGNANGNNAGNDAAQTEQAVLGTITSVSATSITLRTSGGSPVYPLTATTPVTRNGSAAGVTDLKVGDAVVVHVATARAGAAPVVERISVG